MENKELDRLSYALGMSMGHNFKASGIEKINSADFAAGVAAVYEGAEPRLSYDDAKAIIREYFTALEAKQQEAAKEMAAVNAAAGEAFLAENGKRAEVKTTPSGLQYEVVTEGDGPVPTAQDRVVVHYTGRLIDGTVFDSSEERGEPRHFRRHSGDSRMGGSPPDDEGRKHLAPIHTLRPRLWPAGCRRCHRPQPDTHLRRHAPQSRG